MYNVLYQCVIQCVIQHMYNVYVKRGQSTTDIYTNTPIFVQAVTLGGRTKKPSNGIRVEIRPVVLEPVL